MATSLKDTTRATMMSSIVTAITATSNMKVYAGVAPAKTASPTSSGGTLLVTLPCSSTFGTVSGGVLTANAITTTAAVASGTPAFYRIIDGATDDGTHTQIQGSCGVGSGDINFASTIASGGNVSITSLTYTEGNA
jgi:hypothetical protein